MLVLELEPFEINETETPTEPLFDYTKNIDRPAYALSDTKIYIRILQGLQKRD